MPEPIPNRINASVVKAWFQYRCERKTRYEMLQPSALAEAGVVSVKRRQSWAYIGDAFERRVVAALGDRVVRPVGSKAGLYGSVAKAFLAGERTETFAWQVDLGDTSAPTILPLPQDVRVGSTMADLVRRDRVGKDAVFTIIDVKATRKATNFHKAQVAFYSILLEGMLADLGLPGRLSERGEIWHVPEDGDMSGLSPKTDPFVLAPYRRMVSAFCERDLPRILKDGFRRGIDETFFHVYFKCEECQFLARHCGEAISSDRPPQDRDVSAVAGMSHDAKRELLGLGLRSVGALSAAKGLEGRRGLGWSMQRKASIYERRAAALVDGGVLRTAERHSLLMPPRVDVGIYLLADHDPVGDRLATIACLVDRGDGAKPLSEIRVLASGARADEASALVEVFATVIAELTRIDAHNATVPSTGSSAIHAHLFMYETAEAVAIQGAVKRHMYDPRVRQGLMNMIRLFPPEDIVPEPEFRGIHHLPATAVRMVIEQLFALPVTVSHDLAQVSQALETSARLIGAYRPGDRFRRPFSSLLAIDVIKEMEGSRGAAIEPSVRDDVEARLCAVRAIVAFLFEENARQAAGPDGPMLRLSKRPFRFWETFDPLDAGDLDVLQAFELIESRAALLAAMVDLARPLERRVDAGRCLAGLRMVGTPGDRNPGQRPRFLFEVPTEARGAELGPDSFGLALTDGDQQVLLDYAAWSDIECSIMADGAASGQIAVSMSARAFRSPTFQAMYARSGMSGTWVIDRVYKDLNTDRIAAFFKHLAQADPS